MARMHRRACFLAIGVAGWFSAASAGVGVEIDMATLNRLLAAVAANQFDVDLGAGNVVTVELHDLRVTGLKPAASAKERDAILTAVTVVAPQLGLRVPLRPRVVVDVVREKGASLLELRFEDTGLAVPLVGQINFARLGVGGRPGDELDRLVPATGRAQVDDHQRATQPGEMRVPLDEAGDGQTAAEVEHLGVRTAQALDLGARPDGDDPAVARGQRLGRGSPGIERDQLPSEQDQLGRSRGCRFTATAREQRAHDHQG